MENLLFLSYFERFNRWNLYFLINFQALLIFVLFFREIMDQLTSPKIFRSCILFEYFRGKSAYETYENFCEVMGYESIKYKELEIWYHRFSQGEFNLDYDIESNTSDLEFSNLPNDAIEKIIEKCDLKSQWVTQKPLGTNWINSKFQIDSPKSVERPAFSCW